MSSNRQPDSCDHLLDAGAYLLGALSQDEQREFAGHLRACGGCQHEVQQLQIVVDTLPIAAPQLVPPPDLRDRIMRVVDAEAELLRATGPEADRVRAADERTRSTDRAKRSRRWGALLFPRPIAAGAMASILIAVGVAGGALVVSEDSPTAPPTTTFTAKVLSEGSKAVVSVQDGRAALRVTNLPSAPSGKVYQVWIQRAGEQPQPTHTLFNVRKSDGSAVVPIEERVGPGERILVTDEPDGGSLTPTGQTVIDAQLT